MVPKVYTYTSNGGIYTSERMVEVTQSSSEGTTQTTDRKNAVVPIVAAVLSVVIIGTIASFLGCCIWRRRRRRRRAEQSLSEKDPFNQSMSEKAGTSRSPSKRSKAGTVQSRDTLPRTLSSSASVNDHVMETISIAEGTVTPFTLPPPPARSAQREVGHGAERPGPSGYRGSGMHLIEPEEMLQTKRERDMGETDTLMAPGHLRRPSDLNTINTSMSDDDVYAEDGSSLARTLTSESQFSGNVDSLFDSPAAVGRRDPIDTTLSAQSTVRSQGRWLTFGEGTAATSVSPFSTHLTIPSSASPFRAVEIEYYDETPTTDRDSENPFADPEPSSKPRGSRRSILSVSDGGQSEGSNPQTEASYKTGDDASARALPLGAKWKIAPGEKVAVSRKMSAGASSLSQQSFGGWSDSIDEDSDDETVQGDERILGDDESWVNGSEFSRRRNAVERFT